MADTGKPLMRLKDLLELDCDSCSAAGFRCYPRRLGESSPAPLSFCRSPSSLGRSSKLSHISRSLSRRLRGSFWWRRSNNEEEPDEDAAVHGCGYEPDMSPSESSDSSGRTTRSRSQSDSEFSSGSSAAESMHAAVATAAGDGNEDAVKKMGAREEGSSSGSEADDKEQRSPVAVMDFPCFDDDCSPSSHDSLLSLLQAGGTQTHKIRRFGSLDELGPVNLEARLVASQDADDQHEVTARQLPRHAEETTPPTPSPSSSSRHRSSRIHEEHDENGLLVPLTETVSPGVDAVSERLLLDFFVEMKVERAGLRVPAGSLRQKAPPLGDGEILAAARAWLLDGSGWGLEDVLRGGKAVMAEMELGRRWMQVREEEREVGLVVAGVLTNQLMDEVVTDLLV